MELNEELINSLAVDEAEIIERIAGEIEVLARQVRATADLIKEGCTVPFISRYRKENTGSLDEIKVRDISHLLTQYVNLEARRIEIIRVIFGRGLLTPELYENIRKCATMSELEDIYAPYKQKKKTRAMIAIEKGLEPLADMMVTMTDAELEKAAMEFVDAEKGVENRDDALLGAMDIIAERAAQDMDNRAMCRNFIVKHGQIEINGLKNADESVYKMYYDYKETVSSLKSHRIMAINRGEREGELAVKIEFDTENAEAEVQRGYTAPSFYHRNAVADGLKRLLFPAVLRDIRGTQWEEAESEGIHIFSENLRNLLLQPPIKRTRVLGIDPGIRTGTKCAALDENGKYLGYFMIYQHKPDEAKKAIADAVKKYDIHLIAIGNGTGSHEVQVQVAETIAENSLDTQFTVVSEDGASVYSASPLAGEEFPNLDLTIRGAISIGRRLQDPLSELVKIDPQSIGVGMYQHDVNQKSLAASLDEVVESVVNNVGVNINTASWSLLRYVSGVNTTIAKHIVEYRDKVGTIKSRDDLKQVSGMGPKSFEQAAGFLKVPESPNPLDNTWVHPENYEIASEILRLIKEQTTIDKTVQQELKAKFGAGDTTIRDIIEELKKPNRDPREDYPAPVFQKGVVTFEDLKPGMTVRGKVKNVVPFGAFIDLGIKETALLHISELSDRYVKDPSEVIKVGDLVECRIIEMDPVRRRISLSRKKETIPGQTKPAGKKEFPPKPAQAAKQVLPAKEPAPQKTVSNFGTIGAYLKALKTDKE
ncbi:MAG: RNA-binding transcriptional accessory protein [Brevinematales bacterium]|nr:RNA-binding transcriptional accessory protein [Brevinematales bacterium]